MISLWCTVTWENLAQVKSETRIQDFSLVIRKLGPLSKLHVSLQQSTSRDVFPSLNLDNGVKMSVNIVSVPWVDTTLCLMRIKLTPTLSVVPNTYNVIWQRGRFWNSVKYPMRDFESFAQKESKICFLFQYRFWIVKVLIFGGVANSVSIYWRFIQTFWTLKGK